MSQAAGDRRVAVDLTAVIVAVTDEVPRVLTPRDPAGGLAALPSGPLEPARHRTLELGLRSWVRQQTGLDLGYVEQLYTFGNRFRDPSERGGEPRAISIAYLALVQEQTPPDDLAASWRDVYEFLPWEDGRDTQPSVIDQIVLPALDAWTRDARAAAESDERRERVEIAFGLGVAGWDEHRVLERHELLYDAGVIDEAVRDRGDRPGRRPAGRAGEPMALDHRRILASALGRLRGKIEYRPVVFELLPPTFTLLQLQRLVEALAGVRLHKQNFRRLVDRGGLVEATGEVDRETGGRPAERFRFRREVLRERPAPGVPLPGRR